MAGLERRVFVRQLTPLCTSSQDPQNAVKYRARVMPRTTAVVCSSLWPQHRFHHGLLFIVQFPASCHRRIRSCPERIQNDTDLQFGYCECWFLTSWKQHAKRCDAKRSEENNGILILNRSKVDPNRRLSIEDGTWVLRLRQIRSSAQVAAH
jgi:hypothetical protein